MIRTTALPTAVLLGVALLAPTSAYAAGETCRGVRRDARRRTAVRGHRHRGAGRRRDRTLRPTSARCGGDDLVCVTGGVETVVAAGAGNDVVDATAAGPAVLRVLLGGGEDTFDGRGADPGRVGGRHPDAPGWRSTARSTWSGSRRCPALAPSSGPGSKGCRTRTSSASPAAATWSGTARWLPAPSSPAVRATTGWSASLPAGDVEVDLAAGTATGHRQARELRWSGFESDSFSDRAAGRHRSSTCPAPRRDDAVDLSCYAACASRRRSEGATTSSTPARSAPTDSSYRRRRGTRPDRRRRLGQRRSRPGRGRLSAVVERASGPARTWPRFQDAARVGPPSDA